MCTSEGRDETAVTTGRHNPPATNEPAAASCLYYFFHLLAVTEVGKDIVCKIFCWVLKTILRKKGQDWQGTEGKLVRNGRQPVT